MGVERTEYGNRKLWPMEKFGNPPIRKWNSVVHDQRLHRAMEVPFPVNQTTPHNTELKQLLEDRKEK